MADYRAHTVSANGSSERSGDIATDNPPKTRIVRMHDSAKTTLNYGIEILLVTIAVLAVILIASFNLIKSTPTILGFVLKTIGSLPKTISSSPVSTKFAMGSVAIVYVYSFMTDKYLYSSPREWLVGAFGMTCICGSILVGTRTMLQLKQWSNEESTFEEIARQRRESEQRFGARPNNRAPINWTNVHERNGYA